MGMTGTYTLNKLLSFFESLTRFFYKLIPPLYRGIELGGGFFLLLGTPQVLLSEIDDGYFKQVREFNQIADFRLPRSTISARCRSFYSGSSW